MNNIDKLIRHYVLEIIITIAFVIGSIPVWGMLDKSETAKIADMYDKMNYLYLDVDKYIDESNDSFEDVVAVVNNTNTTRNYNLLIKISKDKDCNNAIATINDYKIVLENALYDQDAEYNYYSVAQDNLVASSKDFNISFDNCNLKYSDVEYEIVETEI